MQGLRLELRQSQQLVMTPQLQQAIKLLQMTNQELEAHLADAMLSNPLLTTEESGGPDVPTPEPPAPASTAEGPPGEDPAAAEQVFDAGVTENLREGAPVPSLPAQGGAANSLPDAADRAAVPQDLRASLERQIGEIVAPRAVTLAARCLIAALEDDGYLREPLPAIAERLGVAQDLMARGLALLQRCEPTGVGARTLAECFALQLAERDRLDPMMERLLANLDLIAKGNRRRLAQICEADDEDLDDMLAELRRLNPRPGAMVEAPAPAPRVPDILLSRRADGGWDIALNPETLPRVAVDESYCLSLSASGEETDRWLARQRAEAHWVLRSVAKRSETILKVTGEVVRRQGAFFDEGPTGLRPMTLRHVAEETGLHESTVSRVVAGKLIHTPRGLFELKFFFTNAVGEGDDLSAEAVRDRLRALIEAEVPEKVLSDDDLVAALKAEGMPIARRTVAKYRNAMRIPSSVDRRRQKAFA